jgi:hypothetical protein
MAVTGPDSIFAVFARPGMEPIIKAAHVATIGSIIYP